MQSLLNERGILLADGATGTNLFTAGLQTGDAPELWNTDYPERISALHRSFVEAGSDIILTNSFGGNRYRLALHDASHRVNELNIEAARLARTEADKSVKQVLVAGSIGPTGEILEPNGPLSLDDAKSAFHDQATALAEGGADLLWIETMSSSEEIQAAVSGAAAAGLPVVCTVSIDTNQAGEPAPDADLIEKHLGEISQGAKAQLSGDQSIAGGSATGRGSRPSRRRRRSPD